MSVDRLLPRLRALVLRWLAQRRRARGRYDRGTLRILHRARRTGDTRAWLDYLRFRRDLGHRLHPRFVAPLLARYPDLPPQQQWQAAALLSEIRHPGPEGGWQPGELGVGITSAAYFQPNWRAGFRRALLEARAPGICVVGNAGWLAGSGLGAQIDGAGMVIRFNQFRSDDSSHADIGSRTSAWVTAPGYQGPRPNAVEWVVVSGPDACFHLRNWEMLVPRLRAARPVLTVPLPLWRSLVAVLQAPPSAGVLTLAWLRNMLGDWDDITTVGIGSGARGVYHHADPKWLPSSRHAWAKEAALMERWADEGLRVLASKPAPQPLLAR